MQAISRRAWSLVLVSAMLQILIFPVAGPLPAWRAALGWFALAPFFAALLLPDSSQHRLSLSHSALLGYVCGVLWYLGDCFWIYRTMFLYGGLPRPVALAILIAFALYLGLYHALFALLLALVARVRTLPTLALMAAPFLWVAVELARARITGFPWDLLGYSQIDNLLLTRLGPLTGVMGISFVLAAINSAIVPLLLPKRRRLRIISSVALLLAALLELPALLPAARPAQPPLPRFTAILLQENLLVGQQAHGSRVLSLNDELSAFSRWSQYPLQWVRGEEWRKELQPSRPQIIVWPEAPSHFESDDPTFRSGLGGLAQATGSPIIAGSLGVDLSSEHPRGYFLYDSASLFSADGKFQSRYDKIHLVPWGEYVPYKQLFAFADKLTEGVGDMDRGRQRSVFDTGGHRYGVFICYESIFGDEVRQFVANGADVLVNISDDGWYGDTGAPWQHLNMARMRAIENNRWLLRSTNTGVTSAIDPQGRVALAAPRHVRAAFSFPFDFVTGITFYTRHGDWFAWLCVGLSVPLALLGATRSRTTTRP